MPARPMESPNWHDGDCMPHWLFCLALSVAVVVGYLCGRELRATAGSPSTLAPSVSAPPPLAPSDRLPPEPSRSLLFDPEVAWLHVLADASDSELAFLYLDLLEQGKGSPRLADAFERKVTPLMERWAEVDPLGAARTIAGSSADHLLDDLFALWARLNPDAAASAVAQWHPPSARPELRAILLEAMAERAPEQFLAQLAAGSPEGAEIEFSPAVNAALDTLVARDPDAAKALLATVPTANRKFLIQKIALAIASVDPAAALAWAETLDDFRERDEAMKPAVIALAKTDLAAATALASRFSSNEFPAIPIARSLAESDFDAAYAWILENAPLSSRQFILGDIVLAPLLRDDPARAIDFIREFCAHVNNRHCAGNNFRRLGEAEFPSVAQALESAPDLPGARLAMHGLVEAWVSRYPSAAVDWLLDRSELFETIFRDGDPYLPMGIVERSARDSGARDRLLAHILQLPPDRRKQILAPYFGGQINDPFDPFGRGGRSMALLDSPLFQDFNQLPAEDRPFVVRGLAAEKIRGDPAAAIRWIDTLAEPATREAAIRGAAGAWVDYDPESASNWALALPPGRDRDAAAAQMAQAAYRTDLEGAWAWHGSIASAELRAASTRDLISNTSSFRLGEVEASIRESSLPDAERAEILQLIDQQKQR